MSQELKELKKRRAQEQAEAAARRVVLLAAHLQKRRDSLISGEWWPSHDCDQCLQAILDMSPSAVCETGLSHQWWK
jgi:hypothetical protein